MVRVSYEMTIEPYDYDLVPVHYPELETHESQTKGRTESTRPLLSLIHSAVGSR